MFSQSSWRLLAAAPRITHPRVVHSEYILTEGNLEELVRLTNEELTERCEQETERLQLLDAQIAEVDSRLGKLYDALETGEFKGGELAPRIKVLFGKKEELQQARAEVGESEAKVIYTIPMPPSNVATETVGVLLFIQDGSAYRIRTGDLLLEREVS